jgi:hypothetical protein
VCLTFWSHCCYTTCFPRHSKLACLSKKWLVLQTFHDNNKHHNLDPTTLAASLTLIRVVNYDRKRVCNCGITYDHHLRSSLMIVMFRAQATV